MDEHPHQNPQQDQQAEDAQLTGEEHVETAQTKEIAGSKRRLGRGLNSLLGQSAPPAGNTAKSGVNDLLELCVDDVQRNPFQPRREFDAETIAELSESITQHGILQPLLVRTTPDGYQLISGERRLIAARNAGLRTVPCRLLQMDDQQVFEAAIVENEQRQDLNDLERAQAYQDYLDRFGGSVEELSRKMGKSRSSVSNSLRLLELPTFIKQALNDKKISAGHARALLPLEEEAQQIAMCQRIQSESLSVRQIEEAVRVETQEISQGTIPFRAPDGKTTKSTPPNHHIASLQQQIRDIVGAKVDVRLSGKNKGRIIIHFNSNDEFDRILHHLRKCA